MKFALVGDLVCAEQCNQHQSVKGLSNMGIDNARGIIGKVDCEATKVMYDQIIMKIECEETAIFLDHTCNNLKVLKILPTQALCLLKACVVQVALQDAHEFDHLAELNPELLHYGEVLLLQYRTIICFSFNGRHLAEYQGDLFSQREFLGLTGKQFCLEKTKTVILQISSSFRRQVD